MPVNDHPLPEPAGNHLANFFPLDESMLYMDPNELQFMRTQTGIMDEDDLKKHILQVQAEAYEVYPYPCIRRFGFIRFKLGLLPAYEKVLKLGKERAGAILLDVGCCFGDDVRKAAADGFPAKQIVATDLHPEYWNLGHKLFRSTKESFPATFVPGDVFDPAHIEVIPPLDATPSELPPDLSSLTSLNPLRGHVSVIHASSFFHLFDEETQERVARALASLLSPLPGSVILGTHSGNAGPGLRADIYGPKGDTFTLFCQSANALEEMWDGRVFKKGTVKVETRIATDWVATNEMKYDFLQWSVTRL
ncbi:hypothetical protein BN946_scf184829.g2 [Trametes cinnabarina]|uniref:Methyltransferase domain-containing protein n=1 Tax=Pycnoporus cinnabarinus TaxID=5643 RepID=A0A060SF79_PYCCI|nr:hypothetical protein BN946_scf184829.g2 [Trametes cinnabarina]